MREVGLGVPFAQCCRISVFGGPDNAVIKADVSAAQAVRGKADLLAAECSIGLCLGRNPDEGCGREEKSQHEEIFAFHFV